MKHFAFSLLSGTAVSVAAEKPNVLVIIVDDLNDTIEKMGGHPQARTPNLDRLMAKGIRFTNAQCSAPLCGPSRASFLTGISPVTSGYYGYRQQANHWRNFPALKEARTMMEHFTANGYDVYGTGKVFHGGHEDMRVWRRPDGFKGFGIWPRQGPWPANGTKQNNGLLELVGHPAMPKAYQSNGYDVWLPLSEIPVWPADIEKGIPGYTGWVDRNVDGDKWSDYDFRYVNDDDRDLMTDERSARWTADILKRRHEKPFLVMNGFLKPHVPLVAPKKYFDMFPPEEIQLPPYLEDDCADCVQIFFKGNGVAEHFPQLLRAGGVEEWKKFIRAYLACVAFMDEQVGVLLDALESGPNAENTIVLFFGDHGWHLGEKDWLYKNSIWEESTRVPFIVSVPGMAADAVCEHPVSLLDVYPTLNDLCGISTAPNAGGNGIKLDGHSIRPFLENPVSGQWSGPEVALTSIHSVNPLEIDQPGVPENQFHTIRSRQWRYTWCFNDEEELYNHETDPNEWHNLASNPEYAAIKQQLRTELMKLIRLERR